MGMGWRYCHYLCNILPGTLCNRAGRLYIRWFNVLISFLGLFIGTMQYRDKANEGYLTFGQGFKAGFLMTLINVGVAIIATLVDLQMHPDMIDKILAKAKNDMINKGMTDDQITMRMHYTQMWTTPAMMVVYVVFFGLLFGAILSLITGGLCAKKKPIFDDANGMQGNNTPQA